MKKANKIKRAINPAMDFRNRIQESFGSRSDYDNPNPRNPNAYSGARYVTDAFGELRRRIGFLMGPRGTSVRRENEEKMRADFNECRRIWGFREDQEATILRNLRIELTIMSLLLLLALGGVIVSMTWNSGLIFKLACGAATAVVAAKGLMAWYRIHVLANQRFVTFGEFLRGRRATQ